MPVLVLLGVIGGGTVSAWVDLRVCGFQPAGTEPSQASS